MADIKAKWVRIYSPGGVTVNYQGQTGLTAPMVVSVANIKKFIERGATVEEIKEDETTVLLTLDNYDKDNGCLAVDADAQYAGDVEEEHKSLRKAMQDARLKRIAEEMFDVDDVEEIAIKVISVKVIADINTTKGSKSSDLPLPNTVTANLSNGKTKDLGVTWDLTTVSLGATGTFTAKGTLKLVDDITNPSDIKATVKIVVA